MNKKASVLIVEDERIVAEDIQRSLEYIGYRIIAVASSGEEALQALKKETPDLILMDIVIKGEFTGIETSSLIRSKHDIPIVYLTAYADEATLAKAKLTEPFGYIIKPYNTRELHSTIEMALYKHKTEKKLRESEAWLETTLQSMGDGVIAVDRELNIIFMNVAAEKITGWTQEEAVGRPANDIFKLVRDSDKRPVDNPVENGVRDKSIIYLRRDLSLVTKKGEYIPVDDSISPIVNDRNELVGSVLVFKDITERKKAEQELEKERDFISTLLEVTPAFFIAIDYEGKIRMMNKAAATTLGYSQQEVKGVRFVETFIPERNRDEINQILVNMKTDKKPVLHENRVLAQDGIERLIEWHGRPVFHSNGSFDFFFLMGMDITLRRQTEEALYMSEARYRGLFETMAQGVIYYGIDQKIIACNPAAERILGMEMYAMIGRTPCDEFWDTIDENENRLSPELHPVAVAIREHRLVTNTLLGIRNIKNKRRWLLMDVTPVYQNENDVNPVSVFSTFSDITLRKEMEFELAKRNLQLGSLNIIAHKVSGSLELENIMNIALGVVLDMAGFQSGLMLIYNEDRNNIDFAAHKDINENIIDAVKKMHCSDPVFQKQFFRNDIVILDKKAIKKYFKNDLLYADKEIIFVPVCEGEHVIGSLGLFGKLNESITEMDKDYFINIGNHIGLAVRNAKLYAETREMLEQLRVTQNKLVESEKLAGLGALASNVVHEIGNPLAAISNSIQVLHNRLDLEGRMKELLDIIVWETERLEQSVNELREFSKPKVMNFVESDLCSIIKKAIMILNQDFNLIFGRRIHNKFIGNIPKMLVDPYAIEQIMINLVKNGLQAIPEGGTVKVLVKKSQTKKRPDDVIIDVVDDGPGIDEEDKKFIFEPYFTTKARGMGLGMHIVKKNVEAHNGVIEVLSEKGAGTTIRVKIPVKRGGNGQNFNC